MGLQFGQVGAAPPPGSRLRETQENFPVALRFLPARHRRDLHAVYAFARGVDELGDGPGTPEERTTALHRLDEELGRIWTGGPVGDPVLVELSRTIAAHDLPAEPFHHLVQANLRDQAVTRYATYDELLGYCRLSADPVGRIVLGIFGQSTARTTLHSDRICSALQLLEHWQDVAEDRRAGRVYLPAEDLLRFGVSEADLDAPGTSPALAALIRFEVERAALLLERGTPIVDALHGWARPCVAGFVAGGRATVAALRRTDGDVLTRTPRPSRPATAAHLVALLAPTATSRRGAPMTAAPSPSPSRAVGDAYAACAEITRTQARNFHYGIRLLPPPKRAALCALYALARRIDDIGDGELPVAQKQTALADLRKELDRLPNLDPTDDCDPVLVAVADAARRFPVPLGAFEELVDGVQLDLGEVRIADFEELVHYCRLVAGSVGRLCLSVFGADPAQYDVAAQYADQLGIALQQTNILRDLREDLVAGRVYLPADELARHGVELRLDETGVLEDPQGRLAGYLREAATRAEDWYCLGQRLVPHLDRRSAASCRAMAGIYHHLLVRIEHDPVQVYDRRLSLGVGEKLRVAATSLAGVGR